MKSLSLSLCALALVVSSVSSAQPKDKGLAPYIEAAQPIKDAQGRIEVIVDFDDDADVNEPEEITDSVKSKLHLKKSKDFHLPKVVNFVDRFEKKYGFTSSGMTSRVGSSLTGFLTQKQIDQIRKDKDVKLVTQNFYSSDFSSTPATDPPAVWFDNPPTANGGEQHSWGRSAINGKDLMPGSQQRVFVLDSGVANHDDLNVVLRTNVACGSQGGCEVSDPANHSAVGCYAHATHVAGIIGARNGNGKTSAGVYAGVGIASVSVLAGNGGGCAQTAGGQSVAAWGYALDYVYDQVCANNGGRVGIVNISSNSTSTALGISYNGGVITPLANHDKLRKLAGLITPPTIKVDPRCRRYPGAFIVQSAGNGALDVCSPANTNNGFGTISLAYMRTWSNSIQGVSGQRYYADGQHIPPLLAGAPTTLPVSDGVMVVGAHRPNNLRANWYNTSSGGVPIPAWRDAVPQVALTELGTNFGPCVDVYAPGDRVLSTWGAHSGNSTAATVYTGNAPNGSMGWAYLTGTSMSAPHIAGAAAYLLDTFNDTTAAALETRVRSFFQPTTDPLTVPASTINRLRLP